MVIYYRSGTLFEQKKKFEIIADGLAERRFVYYASSKESGEQLLDMCRASHRFQLSHQAKLSELKRLEEHDRWGIRHHEKYVYSENADFSSFGVNPIVQAVGCEESLVTSGGGSDRRIPSALHRSKNAIRAVSSPPSASTPITASEGALICFFCKTCTILFKMDVFYKVPVHYCTV